MFFLNFSDRRTGNCGSIAAFCAQMQGGRAVDIPEIFARGCGACQTECFQKTASARCRDAPAITALYEAITEQGSLLYCAELLRLALFKFFSLLRTRVRLFWHRYRTRRALSCRRKAFYRCQQYEPRPFEKFFRNMFLPANSPHILFLSAAAYHRVSLRGDLVEVEEVRAALRAFFDEPPVKL